MATTAMTTAISSSNNILTNEELISVLQILNHFETQVRKEAASMKHNGLSNKQRNELCAELGKLQEIKRKLKLMKGIN